MQLVGLFTNDIYKSLNIVYISCDLYYNDLDAFSGYAFRIKIFAVGKKTSKIIDFPNKTFITGQIFYNSCNFPDGYIK